ncbi:MAG TPA: hypothetical protein PLZ32_19280 [Saprospiraceae bacterium]|nr:hypothetical protein [Saprospiraceae bacterium]
MKLIAVITLVIILSGCLHKVSLEMFPTTKSAIDYKKINATQVDRNANLKYGGKQEFCFLNEYKSTEEELIKIIRNVVESDGFKPKHFSYQEDVLIFEKGLSAQAWKSMMGVYYDIREDKNEVEIYVLYQMTQDITGSFEFNYSEVIGQNIRQSLSILNK